MSVRIGLLGTGRIGRMHAELVARRVAGAELAAVYDIAADSATAVGTSLGVPVAASVSEILADDTVDAVCIATSTDTHVDVMVAAAAAGKAIMCEKPVSLDLAEVNRGLAAVDVAGVPLQIGFNRRFDPSHKAVADAVRAGEIGDLHVLKITSRDPAPPPISYIQVSGGIFLDMTIHDFDMARYVTGSEVIEVFARGAVRVDPAIGEAGDLDTVVVTLVHENGALTVIDNSRQAAYGYDQRVEAFGSNGMVGSENPTETTTKKWTEQGSAGSPVPHFFLDRYIPSYVAQWEAFVGALEAHTPPPVSGADGRAPLVMGLAAGRSVREGRPVRIDEVV
jgi:myo-inositol 2-dehydrogenase/D-chiro-inositol 1-dehydrogenase